VKRYFNQLPKLSTQQVVSCGPNGCNGGEAVFINLKDLKFFLFQFNLIPFRFHKKESCL